MKATSSVYPFVLVVLAPLVGLGQSTFEFRNLSPAFGIDAPVFDAEGTPLEGANYLVELWGGATVDSLSPAITCFSNQRVIIPFLSGASAGYFLDDGGGRDEADNVSILAVPPGGWAWLQVRAWAAQMGATYEEAAARGLGGYGESPLFYAQGGYPYDLLTSPPRLIGLQSFSLRPVVPEPAVGCLLLLGLPVLLLRLRWCHSRGTGSREHDSKKGSNHSLDLIEGIGESFGQCHASCEWSFPGRFTTS
jgi:hypothetical protein